MSEAHIQYERGYYEQGTSSVQTRMQDAVCKVSEMWNYLEQLKIISETV